MAVCSKAAPASLKNVADEADDDLDDDADGGVTAARCYHMTQSTNDMKSTVVYVSIESVILNYHPL